MVVSVTWGTAAVTVLMSVARIVSKWVEVSAGSVEMMVEVEGTVTVLVVQRPESASVTVLVLVARTVTILVVGAAETMLVVQICCVTVCVCWCCLVVLQVTDFGHLTTLCSIIRPGGFRIERLGWLDLVTHEVCVLVDARPVTEVVMTLVVLTTVVIVLATAGSVEVDMTVLVV